MPMHFPTVPFASGPLQALSASQESIPPLALIVDDEPVITETLAAILNGSGLAAMTAPNGDVALDTAILIPPEILITDLSMPGMNGLDLAIEIKHRTPDCEVILFSGNATAADIASRASQLGLTFAMLVKPVHPVDLLSCVFEALARRGNSLPAHEPVQDSSLYDYLASTRKQSDRYSPATGVTTRWKMRLSDPVA
ncbi:MAG TPA: response regulator [Terracidiphilus sp.]|nr:response regulator [Terracidiphilus sp.]